MVRKAKVYRNNLAY